MMGKAGGLQQRRTCAHKLKLWRCGSWAGKLRLWRCGTYYRTQRKRKEPRRRCGGVVDKPKLRRCGGCDRLSELPDSLLLHILSFLQMRDAASTALLSRRWKRLWMSTPCLDFTLGEGPLTKRTGLPAASVDRAVARLRSSSLCCKIKAFRVTVKGGRGNASTIDSWLRFAVERGVEELHLDLLGDPASDFGFFSFAGCYALPAFFFTCDSLVSATLQFCLLDVPPGGVRLRNLRNLTIRLVETIFEEPMRDLISGCPRLERLCLEKCNLCWEIQVFVPRSSSLRELVVWDGPPVDGFRSTYMELFAPSVRSLTIAGAARGSYEVKDLSSLEEATIDLSVSRLGNSDDDFDGFVRLLQGVGHAKVLRLCSWCAQALTVREIRGLGLSHSVFRVTRLELRLPLEKDQIPGIFCTLRALTMLEFLLIDIIPFVKMTLEGRVAFDVGFFRRYDFGRAQGIYFDKNSSGAMLEHLKTIRIQNFLWTNACPGGQRNEALINQFKFVKFLLKSSPALEKLKIIATNQLAGCSLFSKMSSILQALPRASLNAQVIIKVK